MSYNLSSKIPNNYATAFVIGVLSALPAMTPSALSLKLDPTYELYRMANLETKILMLPIGFGIMHIFLFYIMNNIFTSQMRTYWMLGFIIGLIYPTLHIMSDYSQNVYGLNSNWTLYITSQCMFLLFYGFVINFLFSSITNSITSSPSNSSDNIDF
jgi:hypothetical protein